MSNRTSEANKAISAAWSNEQQLVSQGKGTRDWTPEQQQDILTKGKAYDDSGKAFEGHHMKSAEKYPEYQGDSENIQFLSRSEHFSAHNNNFQNPTNGYFDYVSGETKSFGPNKYVPCEAINLSCPISNKPITSSNTTAQDSASSISSNNVESLYGGGTNAPPITATDTERYPIKNDGNNGKVTANNADGFYNAKVSPTNNSSDVAQGINKTNTGFNM